MTDGTLAGTVALMGTNYYGIPHNCDELVRQNPDIEIGHHLGKSSGGWKFLARAPHDFGETRPGRTWEAWAEWVREFATIVDEYGTEIQYHDLIELALSKGDQKADLRGNDWLTGPVVMLDESFR